MSFSVDWLALRRDADRKARDRDLANSLRDSLPQGRALRILDLGSGTGANMLALSETLGRDHHWTLIDNDPDLLDQVRTDAGAVVDRRVMDLTSDLGAIFDPEPDLVTASAFFDLCGADHTRRILDACVRAGAVFYTVLTYDGRETWAPEHPLDQQALAAFHADQRRDKGLGPALGPDAVGYMQTHLSRLGYSTHIAQSDWRLSRRTDAALITALAEGAVAAIKPTLGPQARIWGDARKTAASVLIGHYDLLAVPG